LRSFDNVTAVDIIGMKQLVAGVRHTVRAVIARDGQLVSPVSPADILAGDARCAAPVYPDVIE